MLACDIPWSPHLKTLRRCAEPSCIWLYTLEMGGLRIKPWMTKIPPSLCIDWVGSSTIERGNAMDNREYIKSLSLQGTSRSVYKQKNICWQRNRKMNNNGKRNQSDQPPVWPLSTREPMANEAPAKGQTHPVARSGKGLGLMVVVGTCLVQRCATCLDLSEIIIYRPTDLAWNMRLQSLPSVILLWRRLPLW